MIKKRALVMSGGGAKGSFTQGVQIGILWCFVRDMVCSELGCDLEIGSIYADRFLGDINKPVLSDVPDLKETLFSELGVSVDIPDYEFIAGVSVGALQAAKAAQYKYGELYKAIEGMDGIWMGLSGNKDIYKSWCGGRLSGLIAKNALYNSKPLWGLIKRHVTDEAARECGRELRIGCCSYGQGEYFEADQNTPDFWKWVAASSGFAPFFLPIEINGDLWVDGGYRCVTPLKSAIEHGCTDIDVILTGPPTIGKKDPKDNNIGTRINAYHIGMRCVDMMSAEIFLRDVKQALAYNDMLDAGVELKGKRKLNIRLFMPDHRLGSGLDFSPGRTRERRKHGIEVAKRILTP